MYFEHHTVFNKKQSVGGPSDPALHKIEVVHEKIPEVA